MKKELLIITEARFYMIPDGTIYAGEFSFSNSLWNRYVGVFEKIYVIGRVFKVKNFDRVENIVNNVIVLEIDNFDSPTSFLVKYRRIRHQVKTYLFKYNDAKVILKGGGSLSYLASVICLKYKKEYGVEIIGDPYDVFAPGVIKHPLRAVFRFLFTKMQKYVVLNAKAAIYVTKSVLQERYPIRKGKFETSASDVFIEEVLVKKVKPYRNDQLKQLISVGSLEQMYKSPDVVLKMLKKLNLEKKKYRLIWLGHGKYLESMKNLAIDLGIENEVDFMGSVSSVELFKYLDQSDIFVLASRTEGLPRAIVEAMSRGLPCVGTRVGGIPELVIDDLLCDVENIDQLCEKVKFISFDDRSYEFYSQFSIEKAKEYNLNDLEKRRNRFYLELINSDKNIVNEDV